MKTLLVVGSSSRIAREFALRAARSDWSVVLAGHDVEQTGFIARDISVRSGNSAVTAAHLDLENGEETDGLLASLGRSEPLDAAFISAGVMPAESAASASPGLFRRMAMINYVGVAALAERLAGTITPGPDAFLSCLTSVAGDRGRASNFRYGSTKAGLSTFLEGLSVARRREIFIQDVKLGPVDTPLNSGLTRTPFMISPRVASDQIWDAIRRKKNRVYVPKKWALIMMAIRMLPRPLYQHIPL